MKRRPAAHRIATTRPLAKNRRPSPAEFEPRANTIERLSDEEFLRDARSYGGSSRLGELPASSERGVLVMDALHQWAADEGGLSIFALLGEYGMGKTTTCLRFFEELKTGKTKDSRGASRCCST